MYIHHMLIWDKLFLKKCILNFHLCHNNQLKIYASCHIITSLKIYFKIIVLKVAKCGAHEGMDEYYRPIERCKGFIFTTKKQIQLRKEY